MMKTKKQNTKTKKKLHPIFKDSDIRETTECDLECMKTCARYNSEDLMDMNFLPSRFERTLTFTLMFFLILAFMPILIMYCISLIFYSLFKDLFGGDEEYEEY